MRKLALIALSLVTFSGFAQTIVTARFGDLKSNMRVVTNVSDVASLDYVNSKTDELEYHITVITNEMTVVSNKLDNIDGLIGTNLATKADVTLVPLFVATRRSAYIIGYQLGYQTNSPVASLSYAEHLDASIEDLKTNVVWERGFGSGSIVMPNPLSTTDNNVATGLLALAHGFNTKASGYASHTEGGNTKALGISSHAEGDSTTASGSISHAEGISTMASGYASHAEGLNTTASESYSHAEGFGTIASGVSSHSEGRYTVASEDSSHAEGDSTRASGAYSHSEGFDTTASGGSSHAEGSSTEASGFASHSEGISTLASIDSSHAEGNSTEASGYASHSEGISTTASGDSSHSAGVKSLATNNTSFVWQGLQGEPWVDYDPDTVPGYGSHGDGTFNVSPVGGASGFWVGEQTLADIVGGSSGGNVVHSTIPNIWVQKVVSGSDVSFQLVEITE